MIVDRDNNILIFNKLAGEMLGENPDERLGTSILLCHAKESENGVLSLINDIKQRKLDHYEGWINFQGRMLYEYILPIWDAQGNYFGMIEELHDAQDQSEILEFKDIHISGIGNRATRQP